MTLFELGVPRTLLKLPLLRFGLKDPSLNCGRCDGMNVNELDEGIGAVFGIALFEVDGGWDGKCEMLEYEDEVVGVSWVWFPGGEECDSENPPDEGEVEVIEEIDPLVAWNPVRFVWYEKDDFTVVLISSGGVGGSTTDGLSEEGNCDCRRCSVVGRAMFCRPVDAVGGSGWSGISSEDEDEEVDSAAEEVPLEGPLSASG
ncbi:hypothetical protein T439DRAFT_327406 [Meredithblackwellia eburnea MCA 4105]